MDILDEWDADLPFIAGSLVCFAAKSLERRAVKRQLDLPVGDTIYIDDWDRWVDLIEDETGWEKCDYRIPVKDGFYELAVRIEVTGRTIQWRQDAPMVRIKIVFVGDGEPDKVCRRWAYVNMNRIDEARWERYEPHRRGQVGALLGAPSRDRGAAEDSSRG